jgi:hypothetical protein
MSFSDVLDATLHHRPAPPVPSVTSSLSRVVTPPIVAFAPTGLTPQPAARPMEHRGAPHPLPTPVASEGPTPPAEPAASPVHAAAPVSRKARIVRADVVLSPAAQRALAALNDLGAGLDSSMSLADVRGAFRRLARCFHPDRHPGAGPAERQRLSRCFAEATAQYRLLLAAVARRRSSSAAPP